MSDRDAAPDPIEAAYTQAEALLANEKARAARRARVLEAVAQHEEPGRGSAHIRPRAPWRRGGWLAAASVALFCAFLAARIYPPVRERLPEGTPSVVPPAPAGRKVAPLAPAPAIAPPQTRWEGRRRAPAAAPPAPRLVTKAAPEAPAAEVFASPPPPAAPPPPPSPAPAPAPPPPIADPAPASLIAGLSPAPGRAPAPASQGTVGEVVVTGVRIARRDFSSPLAVAAARSGPTPVAAVLSDPAARLRAAAAAGRIPEIERLLVAGAPIDAADAEGNTALMISIQLGRPEAAALLRRHGASLDQKNRAGLSARDMAISKGDPALLQAVGLGP